MAAEVLKMDQGDGKPMEERRWLQQEMLERLLKTTDHIHDELGALTVTMTDRVSKVETKVDSQGEIITGLTVVTAKHSANLSWIKGALAATGLIFGTLIIWILSHIVFKP